MADSKNNVEQIAGNIASAVFSAVIIAIVIFLWMNSSASFKQDSISALAAMMKNTGEMISRAFAIPSAPKPDKSEKTDASKIVKTAKSKFKQRAQQEEQQQAVEQSNHSDSPEVAILPVPPFALPSPPKIPKVVRHGKPVQFIKKTVLHVPLYETIIDLSDPETFISVGLANNAVRANDASETHGDETFESLVKKAHGSVVMNGTFFSKDDQKRVMGNLVSGGKFLKYSRWENFGTTLGLTMHNRPVMITARVDEVPNWNEHWFSLTCGPRLLKDGDLWIHPEVEGFSDSHVLGIGPRCAIGFNSARNKLILCTFMNGLSLPDEARLMKELGCSDAMNLDGGASRSLAYHNEVLVPAGRALTNVLVVYDAKNKAPRALVDSWEQFQKDAHVIGFEQ